MKTLQAIEGAQTLIGNATQLLSTEEGFDREWFQLCEEYAVIKARWHAVNNKRAHVIRKEQEAAAKQASAASRTMRASG